LVAGTIGDNLALGPGVDVDVISVFLQAGDRLTVDVDADRFGSPLDARLRLFDSTGTQLATSDDSPAPGETLTVDPYLDVVADTDGVYFVGVSSFDNEAYDPTLEGSGDGTSSGDYTLSMTLESEDDDGGTDPSVGEPNDTIPTAIATSFSDTITSFETTENIGDNPALAPGLDVDIFEVQLTSGEVITIDTDTDPGTSAAPLDTILRIFDSAGAEIGFNDDGVAPGEDPSLDSYQIFLAPTTDTYYLGISDINNDFYDPFLPGTGTPGTGNTGDYTLSLETLPLTEPDESNDTTNTAIDSGLSTSSPGLFELSGIVGNNPLVLPESDVDLIQVDLGVGDRLTVDVDAIALGSGLDPLLRLFDATGTEVAFSDDDSAPGEEPTFDSYLDVTAATAGTFYVGISSFDNFDYDPFTEGSGLGSSTGYYTLTMEVTAA